MTDHFKIESVVIKTGQAPPTVKIQGNYLKLLRTTGKAPVVVKFDTGFSMTLNVGNGLPIAFKTFTASSPAGIDITADFFISTIPIIEPHKTQDDGTMVTTDTVTVPTKGGLAVKLFTIPGTLKLLGQNWRRREIMLLNTDGANDVYVQQYNNAFGGAGFANAGLPLLHAATVPSTLRTDDDITIGNYNAANVAVMVTQIWYPDLNT